ncbi:MAG: hypothetical protein VX617_03570 [Pseudomonadota bacterium]|nr:hypothetical protein [Pseudomonadota bacterium]
MVHKLKVSLLAYFIVLVGSCTQYNPKQVSIIDVEKPIYCYQSLASVECFAKPNDRDKLRIINFYGPRPSENHKSKPKGAIKIKAPEEIDFWVKDPEPTRDQLIRTITQ